MLARWRKCVNARAIGSASSSGMSRELVGQDDEVGVVAARGRSSPAPRTRSTVSEEPFAGLRPQGFAQQLAEQPHVVAKRFVRIGKHGRTIGRRLSEAGAL